MSMALSEYLLKMERLYTPILEEQIGFDEIHHYTRDELKDLINQCSRHWTRCKRNPALSEVETKGMRVFERESDFKAWREDMNRTGLAKNYQTFEIQVKAGSKPKFYVAFKNKN